MHSDSIPTIDDDIRRWFTKSIILICDMHTTEPNHSLISFLGQPKPVAGDWFVMCPTSDSLMISDCHNPNPMKMNSPRAIDHPVCVTSLCDTRSGTPVCCAVRSGHNCGGSQWTSRLRVTKNNVVCLTVTSTIVILNVSYTGCGGVHSS